MDVFPKGRDDRLRARATCYGGPQINSDGQSGIQRVTASDGDRALRPAYARIPNLILLDMLLPKLSGQRFSILIGLFPTAYAFVAPAAERPDGLRSKSPGAGRTVEW